MKFRQNVLPTMFFVLTFVLALMATIGFISRGALFLVIGLGGLFVIFCIIVVPDYLRSRHKSEKVESTKGGGDEIGAKADKTVLVDDCSPPTNRRPNVYPHRWARWVIRMPSPEMVEALVKSIEFVGKHPWAKWPLMLTYTVFIWPILRGGK